MQKDKDGNISYGVYNYRTKNMVARKKEKKGKVKMKKKK